MKQGDTGLVMQREATTDLLTIVRRRAAGFRRAADWERETVDGGG